MGMYHNDPRDLGGGGKRYETYEERILKQPFKPTGPQRELDDFGEWLKKTPFKPKDQRRILRTVPQLKGALEKLSRANPYLRYLDILRAALEVLGMDFWATKHPDYDMGAAGFTLIWGQNPNCGLPKANAYRPILSGLSPSLECIGGQPIGNGSGTQDGWTYGKDSMTLPAANEGILFGWTDGSPIRRMVCQAFYRNPNWVPIPKTILPQPMPMITEPMPLPPYAEPPIEQPSQLPQPKPVYGKDPKPKPDYEYGPKRPREEKRRPYTRPVHKTWPKPPGGRDDPPIIDQPPKPGEKEIKIRLWTKWMELIQDVFHGITEVSDFVEALWKALPKHRQRGRGLDEKIKDLFYGFDEISIGNAIQNLIENGFEDAGIGRLNQGLIKRAGELRFGGKLTTGGAAF